MELTFVHTADAWYADANLPRGGPRCPVVDDVLLQAWWEEGPEGCQQADFGVEWVAVRGDTPSPKLSMFSDSWWVFSACQPLTALLAELSGQDIQPAEFCARLEAIGFADATPREQ